MDNNNLKILFESVKSKFDFVSDADNTLDGKTGALMGFEVTLGIGYLSLVIHSLRGVKYWEGIFGLIALAVSIITLVCINWPRNYITISVNLFENRSYLSKPIEELFLQLISDAQNAFTENRKILDRKTRWYKSAVTFLVIGTILLALSKLGRFYV